MSKEDFARSQGFSDAYLRALVRKGVVIPVGGKIDYDQAIAAIEAQRTPRMQKRKGTAQNLEFDEEGIPSLQKSPVTRATELSTILLETRIRNEIEKGKLLAVEAKVKTGQYVDAAQVDKEAFQAARTTRDALLNIPDRVSHLLATVSDPTRIHEVLEQELRTVLESLSDKLKENV